MIRKYKDLEKEIVKMWHHKTASNEVSSEYDNKRDKKNSLAT